MKNIVASVFRIFKYRANPSFVAMSHVHFPRLFVPLILCGITIDPAEAERSEGVSK